jgi:hypothetical protein
MPSAGFEPAFPAFKLFHSYAIDNTATEIGLPYIALCLILFYTGNEFRIFYNTLKTNLRHGKQ